MPVCLDGDDGDFNGLIASPFFVSVRFGEALICNGGGIRNIPAIVECSLRALPLPTEVIDFPPPSRASVFVTSFLASKFSVKEDFLFGCGRVNGFLFGTENFILFRSGEVLGGRRGTGEGRRGFENCGRGLDVMGVDFGVTSCGVA